MDPGTLKRSTETGVLRAATKWRDPSSARFIDGKLFAITTEPRQACSNTAGGHIPSNFTIFSIDHQAPLTNPTDLGEATGCIPASPLIAFRRPRNLRDLLVRASLNDIQNETPGNRPCGAAGCKTCPILTATDEFTTKKTGQKFKMKFAASCKSSNIIYLITCRRCGLQYVGETGHPLHGRINGHRFNIAHRRTEESPVAAHFNGEGHSQADMVVAVIDQLYSRDPCLRKIRESRWIRTLGTSHPSGMNLRVDSLWNLLDNHLWTPWTSQWPPSTSKLRRGASRE